MLSASTFGATDPAPAVHGEQGEPGTDGGRLLDLNSLRTSNDIDGGMALAAGRGYLRDGRTGRIIAVGEPWRLRARRAYRVGCAWLDVVWPLVADGRCYMAYWGLTIADGCWHPRMMPKLMAELRRRLGAGLVDYFWVAELQARGAVHYNLLLVVRRGVFVGMPDKLGLWPHGSTFTRAIRRERDAYYALRYIGKERQKGGPGGPPFPKGLRLYGMRLGKLALSRFRRVYVMLARLPAWLREAVGDRPLMLGYSPRRRRGGGWWFDGAVYRSPWRWSACAVDLRG